MKETQSEKREGGGYFVGFVPQVEKSNTLLSRDEMYRERTSDNGLASNSDDKYRSSSEDSKKVRFVGTINEDKDEDTPRSVQNGDSHSFRSAGSRKSQYGSNRNTPTKSNQNPSLSKTQSRSSTKSVGSSVDSGRFKFHASNDVTPDLILPEKRAANSNSRSTSTSSNLKENENFKYHASPDVRTEATPSGKTSRNTKDGKTSRSTENDVGSNISQNNKNVFLTGNVSATDDESDWIDEDIYTTRTGDVSKTPVKQETPTRHMSSGAKQTPRNVKLNHTAKNGSINDEGPLLTDEANTRQQTRQSDSITSLPPAKQNGSLVTGDDVNNNNGSKKEVKVTQGQTGYFRNKKISSPPMRKNMKPRTGSAPSQTPLEPVIEDTPRLRINNLVGFDKTDKNSQNKTSRDQMMDEEINTRIAKTKDNKSFSNSYLKAKTENPSNYAANGSKSESSVKQDKTKSENKTTTSVRKDSQNSVIVKSSSPNNANNVKTTEESKTEPKNTSSSSQKNVNEEESSKTGSKNGVNSEQRKQSQDLGQTNVEKSTKAGSNYNGLTTKTGNKNTQSNNGSTTIVKETQNKQSKEDKKQTVGENEKTNNKDVFHYHAQSKASPERERVSYNTDKDKSDSEDTSVPPLDLSQKPRTKNGKFKFVINKNASYHYRRKRWSSKSDPTGTATPGKEKSSIYKERPKSILANQQEVRPITKNTPRTFKMDEKEKSIYRNTTFTWDEDTSEAYHTPAVNRPKGITKTYTGAPSHREALKSARGRPKSSKTPFVFLKRSKVPPWYEKAKVLSRQQVNIFQNIKSVYGDENVNKNREAKFLEKVQKVQLEQSRLEYEDLMEKERQKKLAKRNQARQLKELRKRFEDEAWHRFQTQYVTSRILEHEKLNRYEYGLPEEPSGKPEYASKLKRKKKVPDEPVSTEKLKKVNQKKYGKMFGMKMGPEVRPKTPLMEGIDTVVITQTDEKGNTKEKKKMVKSVITEAKDQITKVPQKGTGFTPREDSTAQKEISRKTPSLNLEDDDDDDDMSDIFEHARKKYHLDIDDEDD